MGARELLHEIVGHLPIHEKVKADLHKQVDEAVPPEPEPVKEEQ